MFGATQTRTTPYHPASNGQVERFNRSLLQMIRCHINRDQTVWDEQLPLLLAAYRSTPHQSTGISPNFMMLGREVHQMTDLVFKDSEATRKALDHATYIEKLKSALDTAHSVARKSLHKCQQKQKRLHDVRLFNNQYEIGDLVYVNKMAKKVGKCPKLEHVWEGPFIIVKKYGAVLYEVQGRKTCTVIHHDRLKAYKSDVVPGWVTRFSLVDQLDTLPMETISELDNEQDGVPASKHSKPICVKQSYRDLTLGSKETPSGFQRTRAGRQIKPPDRLDL